MTEKLFAAIRAALDATEYCTALELVTTADFCFVCKSPRALNGWLRLFTWNRQIICATPHIHTRRFCCTNPDLTVDFEVCARCHEYFEHNSVGVFLIKLESSEWALVTDRLMHVVPDLSARW